MPEPMAPTTPNRMQKHWEPAKAFLKREWPKLTEVDLEEIDGEYDRLIHKIWELYDGPQEIMQEASIKSKLQSFFNYIES